MMLHIFVGLIITLILVLTPHVTDGCGRTPSKPQTTASPLDSVTNENPTHRFPCEPYEENISQCLNGGKCFALYEYGGNRSVYCECSELYRGQRCEEISPDIIGELHRGKRVVTASVAASVVLLVLILVIVIAYCAIKRKRRRALDAEHRNVNGTHLAESQKFICKESPEFNHIENGKRHDSSKETNV